MSHIDLRYYQTDAITGIQQKFREGKKYPLLVLQMGLGKSLCKNTPVLMYDGTIKMCQNVKMGDVLMGDDSQPRNVLSTSSGIEKCYNIIPKKGMPWSCNESHIMTFQKYNIKNVDKIATCKKTVEDVNLKDWLSFSKYTQSLYKLIKVPVEFKEQAVPLDPYFLGVWLGDGTSKEASICTPDIEIKEYFEEYAKSFGLGIRQSELRDGFCPVYHATKGSDNKKQNYIFKCLRDLNLINNKHIPLLYLVNSREQRLKLLAGLLDTDGYLIDNTYEIVTKFESLKDGICYLAGSLGFGVQYKYVEKGIKSRDFKGMYYRIHISGDTNLIPLKINRKLAPPRKQKKNILCTSFSVEPIGNQEYFGFEIDGNRRFLLGDFTVTHNTVCAARIIQLALSNKKRVLFIAHRTFLITQCRDKLLKYGIHCGLIKSGFKEDRSQPVQVASIQTLVRRNLPLADIIIIDEAHHAVSAKYMEIIDIYKNNNSFAIGLTATPFLLSRKIGLSSVFDCFVNTISVAEAIEKEFLLDSKVYGMKKMLDLSNVKKTAGDYDQKELYKAYDTNDVYKNLITQYHTHIGTKSCIVFCVNKDHCRKVATALNEAGYKGSYAIDETSEDERVMHLSKLESGEYTFMCNVGIWGEGLDAPYLQATCLVYDTLSKSKYFQSTARAGRPLMEDQGVPMHLKKKPYYTVLDMGGNTKRFGPVEQPFEISLEPRGASDKEGVAPIKNCHNCGYMMAVQMRSCPECKTEMPPNPKTKKEIQEEEFIELNKKRLLLIPYLNLPTNRYDEIPSELLEDFAKEKGYKKGWVKYILIARGEARKPIKILNYDYPDYFKQKGILEKAYYDKTYPIDAHTWQFIEEKEKEIIYTYIAEPKMSIL